MESQKQKLISELEEAILLLKSDKIEIGMLSNREKTSDNDDYQKDGIKIITRKSKWKKIVIQYKLKEL